MSNRADVEHLIFELEKYLETDIKISGEYLEWQSGVYAVVDCVFSARAKYDLMVLPILQKRLPLRPDLQDDPELKFSAFLQDMDSFGVDKFERYAKEVVMNRQKISDRLKAEICYDVCQFFVQKKLETKRDLQVLEAKALEQLVLNDLQQSVRGIGPALARYLLMLFGDESHIKPDTIILRFFSKLSEWQPRFGIEQDIETIRLVIANVALKHDSTPARLDHAIWLFESRSVYLKN
jgi:hypothetical protein